MSQSTPTVDQPAAADVLKVEPQPQHRWLRRLVGEWTYASDVPAEGNQPAHTVTGVEHVRAIGDLWVVGEAKGEMPGAGPATSIITLGYNSDTKRFVGSWIGSMMTHMWVYDGELDAAEKILTLTSQGPSMAGDGTLSTYQDIIEFTGDNHRVLTARVRQADGTWQQFMTVEYRRRS